MARTASWPSAPPLPESAEPTMPRDPSRRRAQRAPKNSAKSADSGGDVVRLEDLEPRKEVRGGARKRLFGEEASSTQDRRRGDG